MPIQFRCTCGQVLAAQDGSSGKHAKCPKCSELCKIPAPPTSPKPESTVPKPVSPATPAANLAKPVVKPAVSSKPVAQARPVATPVQAKPIAKPVAPGPQQNSAQQKPAQTIPLSNAEPDPLSVDLPTPAFDPFSAPAVKHPKVRKKSNIPWAKIALGIGGASACVLLAYVAWQFLPSSSGTGEIESSFEPIQVSAEELSQPGSATGSISIAQQFVSFAQQNDAQSALALIDRDEFRKRVRSKHGSYEAMRNRLSIDELLGNLDNYSLEKVEADNGHRKWQILGTSRFRGDEGVVVRYYVEPKPAAEVFRDRDRLLQIVELIEFDQFMSTARNVFSSQQHKHTNHDSYSLRSHSINAVNPRRVGYLLLVINSVAGEDKLVDVVNILGQTPYSQTCGKVYKDDYHIFGVRGQTESFGTEPIELSIYGASPLTGGFSAPAGDQEAWDAAKAEAEAKTKRVNGERPKRLERIGSLLATSSPELDGEIATFRSDFPGDLGIELATVIQCMQPDEPYCNEFLAPRLKQASLKLYSTWQDPFLFYCEAVAAWKTDDRPLAEKKFRAAMAAGFETADLHAFLIDQALRKSDRKQLLDALANFDRYCKSFNSPPSDSLAKTFRNRWDSCYNELHPQPTLADRMQEQAQQNAGRGGRGRPGGFPFSNRPGGPGREFQPNADSPTFGQNQPNTGRPGSGFGNRGGFGGRGFGQQASEVPKANKVTIKIVAASSFDVNKMFNDLRTQLNVKGGSCSRSNNRGQIVLHYSGAVENVVDAIDFGTIKSKDHDNRLIEVSIDR